MGVSHECDYPPFVRSLPNVTRALIPDSTSSAMIDQLVRQRLQANRARYALGMPALEGLRPELIVTQALCDVCAVAEEEVRAVAWRLPGHPRVINLEPMRLSDVFASIRQVGAATGAGRQAKAVVASLMARIANVAACCMHLRHRPRVAMLEWLDPPFSCGHWSPELVRLAGGVEGLGREGQPSRTLRWEEVVSWQPEVVLMACCGFSAERTLLDLPLLSSVPGWRTLPALRSGHVYVVDGSQYFSRPGPRLVDSLEILAHALQPELHPLPAGLPTAQRVTGSALDLHHSPA